MLSLLLSYHQIRPDYLDFMFLFGQSIGPNDEYFSGFREQTQLRSLGSSDDLTSLGRSGKHYSMSFNLKTVQRQDEDIPFPWSIRQASIYHSLDVEHGTTTWIITRALSNWKHDLKERVEELTGLDGRSEDRSFEGPEQSFRSSLAVHSMLIHWAAESWRWHLQWLDKEIEAQVDCFFRTS